MSRAARRPNRTLAVSSLDVLLSLAEQANRALQPLEQALGSEEQFAQLLASFGWQVAPASFSIGAVRASLPAGADLGAVTTALGDISTPADFPPIDKYVAALDALKAVMDALRGLSGAAAPAGIPAGAWSDFTAGLLDSLLVDYLTASHPAVLALLLGAGVVTATDIDPGGAAGRVPSTRWAFDWGRLPQILGQPAQLTRSLYGWRDPAGFKFDVALSVLAHAGGLLGLPVELQVPSAARLDEFYDAGNPHRPDVRQLALALMSGADESGNSIDAELLVMPIPEQSDRAGAPSGLVIGPSVALSAVPPAALLALYSIDLAGSGGRAAYDGANLQLLPSGISAQLTAAGQATVDVSARLSRESDSPRVLLGSIFSHRLELYGYAFGLAARGPVASAELALSADITRARLVVDASDGDGFLGQMLGGGSWTLEFASGLEWSSKTGLHLHGSGAIETTIPLNLSLGVAEIMDLVIRVAAANGGLGISAGIDGKLALGPFAGSVKNVGVTLQLTPIAAGAPAGVFGDLDLGFGFKPPDGLGLAIDAGIVKGGGFILFEPDQGRYAGVLELSLEDIVQIKAIGVLDTKLPDGSSGFALLLILTAEFEPGIQLGFGFSLTGVGGLVGLNRTMNTDALRSGLRNHTLDSILFPPDPVANAPRIISDIETVFPPAAGRYLFGPMLQIGWGVPTLISAELGLILELPDPVLLAILGQIRSELPSEDLALVELHLDAIGILDFAAKDLSIDATLYGSRVLVYSLDGDMAMRLNWSDQPFFALAVGGFHPRFSPPPGMAELHRCSLSIGDGDNPRLSCQTYWAITSNSVQFGARVELYASAAGFSVHGYLGFDVLIIISPFSFEADMDAGVDLLSGSSVLMSIHLSFTLSGPTPWHARGSASVDILFFSVSVDFDVSWGDDHPATLPAVDAKGPLLAALAVSRNWSAGLPEGVEPAASLAPAPVPPGTVLVHPLGRLTVKQRVVPLDMPISRFGSGTPDHWNCFSITKAQINGADATTTSELDRFAPGQFEALSNDDQLARPAFESMHAGVSFGSSDAKQGSVSDLPVHFETIIIDDPVLPSRRLLGVYRPGDAVFGAHVAIGAAGLSQVRASGNGKYVAPDMRGSVVAQEVSYVIASTEDLSARPELLRYGGGSQTAAVRALEDHLRSHPEDAGRLQVIPDFELAA